MRKLKIHHTVYPEQQLDKNEWMQKYRVSSQWVDRRLMDSARDIMREWQTDWVKDKEVGGLQRLLTAIG